MLACAGALAAAGIAAVMAGLPAAWRDPPPETLEIAEASQPAFALLYVAEAKGYFRDAGLEVRFSSFRLGRDAITSVLEGKADLATAFETPVVTRIYEGQPLAIVSGLHTSTRNQMIVARRDRGIARPADLRGRTVGVTPGTSVEYMFSTFLAAQGLPASAVRTVRVEPERYEAALADGSVDAVAAFNPYPALIARSLGRENLAFFHSDTYVETSMLAGLRPRLEAKRPALEKLARALARAHRFVQENDAESLEIVARRLAKTHPEWAVRETWGALRIAARLDHVLLRSLQAEGEWLRETGRFSGPVPDFAAAVEPAFLAAASPGTVTLRPRRDAH